MLGDGSLYSVFSPHGHEDHEGSLLVRKSQIFRFLFGAQLYTPTALNA